MVRNVVAEDIGFFEVQCLVLGLIGAPYEINGATLGFDVSSSKILTDYPNADQLESAEEGDCNNDRCVARNVDTVNKDSQDDENGENE